jgi:two-component system nitrate/nitrite response regulator NarL
METLLCPDGHFRLHGYTFDVRCLGAMMTEPIQVLIADDSEAIRRAIRLLLQPESISITGELASFTELLATLKSVKPDVVLMDLHMPGEEHAGMVEESMHGTCLIALSLWDDAETQGLAEYFGATRLLNKSTLAATLVDAIHECMNKAQNASA